MNARRPTLLLLVLVAGLGGWQSLRALRDTPPGPPPACVEGDTICDGDVVKRCVSGKWDIVEDCAARCAGTCIWVADGATCLCSARRSSDPSDWPPRR